MAIVNRLAENNEYKRKECKQNGYLLHTPNVRNKVQIAMCLYYTLQRDFMGFTDLLLSTCFNNHPFQ
jgi:hypothetical protein